MTVLKTIETRVLYADKGKDIWHEKQYEAKAEDNGIQQLCRVTRALLLLNALPLLHIAPCFSCHIH